MANMKVFEGGTQSFLDVIQGDSFKYKCVYFQDETLICWRLQEFISPEFKTNELAMLMGDVDSSEEHCTGNGGARACNFRFHELYADKTGDVVSRVKDAAHSAAMLRLQHTT